MVSKEVGTLQLGRELTRDGTKKETLKLLEYERIGDKRVLDNTTMQTWRTFVGYGTEYKEEYDQTLNEGKKHVIFTDRKNIKDMPQGKDIQKIYQCQGVLKK
eukprot:10428089-Ditylum_brightwellii.AAC.1